MSTNYYLRADPCRHCGRGSDDLHICQNMTNFEAVFGPGDALRISTLGVGRRSTWLDPDGFTFYGGEFC